MTLRPTSSASMPASFSLDRVRSEDQVGEPVFEPVFEPYPGTRPRPPMAPPAYDARSAATASPIHSRSIPSTPPGDTSTYIKVVHGRNRKPRNGRMKLSNAADQRSGSMIHQRTITTRGPKSSRLRKKHMTISTSDARP